MTSIRSRLIAGLSLIILFFIAQAALVYFSQQSARQDVVETTRKNTIAAAQLSELSIVAQQARRYEKEYFVYVNNPERRAKYTKEWTEATVKMDKGIKDIRANSEGAFTQEEVVKVADWVEASDFYRAEMERIFGSVLQLDAKIASHIATQTMTTATVMPVKAKGVALAVTEPVEAAPAMFTSGEVNTMITAGKDRLSASLIKGAGDMLKSKTAQTLSLGQLANDQFNKALYGVLATVVVGILIAALLAWRLPKAVTGPLAKLTHTIDEISKGNLDTKVDTGGVAEFEGVTKALGRLRLGQAALVARLRR
jgi:HAMP domain-containing protein